MSKDLSLKELTKIAEAIFKDYCPKKLPNGLWEIAEGCITNEKGLEMFSKMVFDDVDSKRIN